MHDRQQTFIKFDFHKSVERTIEIAKLIDPLAWKHGYERPREVSLRIASKIVAGYPELACADALITPEPIEIPITNLNLMEVQPQPKPTILARLTLAWRTK
jgi:hypothetical protein